MKRPKQPEILDMNHVWWLGMVWRRISRGNRWEHQYLTTLPISVEVYLS